MNAFLLNRPLSQSPALKRASPELHNVRNRDRLIEHTRNEEKKDQMGSTRSKQEDLFTIRLTERGNQYRISKRRKAVNKLHSVAGYECR